VHHLRPGDDDRAVCAQHDDVGARPGAADVAVSVRRGDRDGARAWTRAALPAWQEPASRPEQGSDRSIWYAVRAAARRRADDVSGIHREDEDDAHAAEGGDWGRGRWQLMSAGRWLGPGGRAGALASVALLVLAFGVSVYTQGRAGGPVRGAQAPQRAQTPWPPKLEVPAPGEVEVLPVQGNVYMIAG